MPDLEPMSVALAEAGEIPAAVLDPECAHVVAYGNQLESVRSVPGVTLTAEPGRGRIQARLIIGEGHRAGQPIHLCFAMLDPHGSQLVDLDLVAQADSRATIWSHCLFNRAEDATHAMAAHVQLEPRARLAYQEIHYHGTGGGMRVVPRAVIELGPGARYQASFSLVRGRVGRLDIDYTVNVGDGALAELVSKVYGYGTDEIKIRERIRLNGANSRGLIKARVAVRGDATAEIAGATYGNAAGARGHVDCTEIVRDRAVVSAIPEVRVTHPLAKVTHEAAIGSVDSRQLETLMARGLDPEAAVDAIIRGMLA